MIDLDAYDAALRAACADEGDTKFVSGVRFARTVLRTMRALALPDPSSPSMPVMHATPTTQAMRRAAFPRSGTLRAEIVALLAHAGRTDDALERDAGRTHQSVSAARHGLVKDGWVRAATYPNGSKITARTRSGNPAQVWEITPAGRLRHSQATSR